MNKSCIDSLLVPLVVPKTEIQFYKKSLAASFLDIKGAYDNVKLDLDKWTYRNEFINKLNFFYL